LEKGFNNSICLRSVAGILAKEIGGGRFAQVLAECALAASPIVLAFGGFYSMNSFELLFAIGAMHCTVRMIKENNAKRWIVLGILMGFGMMNKHTFAVFAAALVVSLLVASIVLQLMQTQYYDRLKEWLESVEPCDGEFSSPYVSSHENHLKVFVCRGPKSSLGEMLERRKNYY
jgi:uncharacterized membrane protein